MMKTVGVETVQLYTILWVFGIMFFRLFARFFIALRILVNRGGVSFVPKANVEVWDMPLLTHRHQEEFIRLLQKAPQPYEIESVAVSVHVDIVRVDVTRIDVHVVGVLNGGWVRVFCGVPLAAIKAWTISEDTDWLASESESNSHKFIDSSISFPNTQTETTGTIPVVVIVYQDNQFELTLWFGPTRVEQFLVANDKIVSIKGVFTGDADNECFVCYDRKANTVILPCRHSSICTGCVEKLREPKCVVCRSHFAQYLALH